MSVQVYGCNHIAIEVDDIEKAIAFYKDVFNLEQMSDGEGDAFFKLGEHQFLAVFEVENVQPANMRHFGIMVRDEAQLQRDDLQALSLNSGYYLPNEVAANAIRLDQNEGALRHCCSLAKVITHL